MSMKVSFHVMHVPGEPRRVRCVEAMREQMDVAVHPDPQLRGAAWNWMQMLHFMAKKQDEADWFIHLNDDAVLLDGWQGHLEQALIHSPSHMLGLAWVGKTRGMKAYDAGVPYAVGPYLPAGLAIAYHRSIVGELSDFAKYVVNETDYRHDDVAACAFHQYVIGVDPAVVARSIFGVDETVSSLMGHARYRSAAKTILDEGPEYTDGYVVDNSMARRDDEEKIKAIVDGYTRW